MAESQLNRKQMDFVHGTGMSFERVGPGPMTGRVYAVLLMTPENEPTAEQLASTLHASRGAISQATRSLIAMRILVRSRKPGDRKDYFRIQEGGWAMATMNKREEIEHMRYLFELGITAIDNPALEAMATLRDHLLFLEFWEEYAKRFAHDWEEWKENRNALRDTND